MLKNDRWINEQAAAGMLQPFQSSLVRHLDPEAAGLAGAQLRLLFLWLRLAVVG